MTINLIFKCMLKIIYFILIYSHSFPSAKPPISCPLRKSQTPDIPMLPISYNPYNNKLVASPPLILLLFPNTRSSLHHSKISLSGSRTSPSKILGILDRCVCDCSIPHQCASENIVGIFVKGQCYASKSSMQMLIGFFFFI